MMSRLSGLYRGQNFALGGEAADRLDTIFAETRKGGKMPADAAEGAKAEQTKEAKFAGGFDRIFGPKKTPGREHRFVDHGGGEVGEDGKPTPRRVSFGNGPLGMEIAWSLPPVVSAVVPGGVADAAAIAAGSMILRIGGADAAEPRPRLEWEAVLGKRPVILEFGPPKEPGEAGAPRAIEDLGPVEAVRWQGVARMTETIVPEGCEALLKYADKARQAKLGADDPHDGSRWEAVLPPGSAAVRALMCPVLKGPLGAALEALVGDGGELVGLCVAVSEPGAAAQPVHYNAAPADARGRGTLVCAAVALDGGAADGGRILFLPGTHTQAAHRQFEAAPAEFVRDAEPLAPPLAQGDTVLYDARVMRGAGENTSDARRAVLRLTFQRPDEADMPGRGGAGSPPRLCDLRAAA